MICNVFKSTGFISLQSYFEIIFSNISRCRELQDQMARLIEQQNTIDPEMVALQQAMQGSDINQSRTSQSEVASISQLDCRICFENDNEKVCLPVSNKVSKTVIFYIRII